MSKKCSVWEFWAVFLHCILWANGCVITIPTYRVDSLMIIQLSAEFYSHVHLVCFFISQLYIERCLLTEDQGDLHTWIQVSTQFNGRFLYCQSLSHNWTPQHYALVWLLVYPGISFDSTVSVNPGLIIDALDRCCVVLSSCRMSTVFNGSSTTAASIIWTEKTVTL